VKTAVTWCISHIQYWTVWNEVQTFEYSWIHIVEIKQGLWSVYQSNFTSMYKPKSKPLIRPNKMSFWDFSRCAGKLPTFSALILQIKVLRTNDVNTALNRWVSHLQYWTIWNEVQTFEYSRIHFVEIKQGLSREYQSNFTSMAKQKSKLLIRPYSVRF
jgi:hypothetical protein